MERMNPLKMAGVILTVLGALVFVLPIIHEVFLWFSTTGRQLIWGSVTFGAGAVLFFVGTFQDRRENGETEASADVKGS